MEHIRLRQVEEFSTAMLKTVQTDLASYMGIDASMMAITVVPGSIVLQVDFVLAFQYGNRCQHNSGHNHAL